VESISQPVTGASKVTSGIFLVAANLIPLAGAVFRGWSILDIVAVYWAENLVIGGFTILRLYTADAKMGWSTGALLARTGFSGFFTFHYGIFCLVHGFFVFNLLDGDNRISSPGDVIALFTGGLFWAMAALIASHAFSFLRNYIGRGEYRETSLPEQMMAPYPRIVVLHVAILFGAFAIQTAGEPVLLLVILVVGKTLLDLKLHRLSHKRKPEDDAFLGSVAKQWAERQKP
jgi:hypothetical protein